VRARVTHLLSAALILASFIVALAVGIGWARSYGLADTVAIVGPGGRPLLLLAVAKGSVFVLTDTARVSGLPFGSIHWWPMPLQTVADSIASFSDEAKRHWQGRGFSAGFGVSLWNAPRGHFAFASAPAWLIFPLAVIFPVRWSARQFRSQRRIRRGQCLKCGYDLRASTERCPECGQLIQA
jgi:hypothetical protein